jgi:hypothetical protein
VNSLDATARKRRLEYKLKLYENVVIGNFLYALGAAVQAKSNSNIALSAVSLLQQTPADKELGDVLLEFPGVIRLIEFKSLDNKSPKEKVRHCQLTAAIGEDKYLIILSKSIHWFVGTVPKEQKFDSYIVPYLEAYSGENSQYSLERFIEVTAEEAVRGEGRFSREDLRYYLSLIAHCQGTGNINTGALLLSVDTSGNINYIVLRDMMELRLQHRDFVRQITINRQQELEYKIERELENKNELEREKSRSIGWEIGF